jgi:hypothetical protein
MLAWWNNATIHRGFIAGRYDGGQDMTNQERHVSQEPQPNERIPQDRLLESLGSDPVNLCCADFKRLILRCSVQPDLNP